MNTTTIAKSVKYEAFIEEEFPTVTNVDFTIGHKRYRIAFETGHATTDKVIDVIKIYTKKAIKDAKNWGMIKIGDYDISVQEIGIERVVYANDKIISKTKVGIYSNWF